MVDEQELREAECQAGRECERLLAEIERLQAENARLRAACERWLAVVDEVHDSHPYKGTGRLTREIPGR